MRYLSNIFFTFLCATFCVDVFANLMITPTRISFAERDTTAKVYIINTSNEEKTYRLIWTEKIAKSEGGYTNYNGLLPTSLSPMMRMSPSQVTLKPGEKQVVKLAVRKPKGLKSQEYRSHLLFQALPNQKLASDKELGISLNMILSYSIPVILKYGSDLPQLAISDVNVAREQISFNFKHKGDFSAFGDVAVYFKGQGTEEPKHIGMLAGHSVYPELTSLSTTLRFLDGYKITEPGDILIKYIGKEEYKGVVFAEKIINLKSLL
jgi:hypothetical protein